MSNKKVFRCEICGRVLEHAKQDDDGIIYGVGCNNPDPLKYKVCCDVCVEYAVIPARINEAYVISLAEKERKLAKNKSKGDK